MSPEDIVSTDAIAIAPSGRALCKKCKSPIALGEARFGVGHEVDEREQHAWYHLGCAAHAVPARLQSALRSFPVEVPDLERVIGEVPGLIGEPLPERAITPLTCEDAVERWRAVPVEASVDSILQSLRAPLPAPAAFNERRSAWQVLRATHDVRDLVRILRSFRSLSRTLSYSERHMFDQVRDALAKALSSLSGGAESEGEWLTKIDEALHADA